MDTKPARPCLFAALFLTAIAGGCDVPVVADPAAGDAAEAQVTSPAAEEPPPPCTDGSELPDCLGLCALICSRAAWCDDVAWTADCPEACHDELTCLVAPTASAGQPCWITGEMFRRSLGKCSTFCAIAAGSPSLVDYLARWGLFGGTPEQVASYRERANAAAASTESCFEYAIK